ncbi:DUF4932 domain-containing protein [Ferruginibacter paludis]|uniref:DUF4932 domain-containing protein n=1 Tax=Ferruginibacter paludis TaxID=1310417 RepID=UPI0025B32BDC|nr:DUF4932 domain-containing protein [Ferruginibacter paludis]MDN3659197.1 DUF4932 domain-containing protein [Ferruginibacter paludis]
MKKITLCFSFILMLTASCSHYAGSFRSSNTPGQMNESFGNFNKTDAVTFNAAAGDIIFIHYSVQLTQGNLQLAVKEGINTIWSRQLSPQNDTILLQLTADKTAPHSIEIKGDHADGSLLLNYKTVAAKKINVISNANLELFGLILQLDMGPDLEKLTDSVVIDNKKTTWQDWNLMAWKNYSRYKAFDSCAMMQLYRQYQAKQFYNDFFIGLLEQVDEVPNAKLNNTTNKETILAFSGNGDAAAGRLIATAFLDSFNSFYKAIHFEKWLEENKSNFQRAKMDVEKNLPSSKFIPTMENFYNKSFHDYNLVPVMNLITSSGYGKMNAITQSIYNAFAPFSFQSFDPGHLDLGFDYPDRIQGLSVHEFGHSFVNGAIDQLPEELKKSTEYLYLPIKDAMRKQSYTNWVQSLYEHFVRAGEVIIARQLGDTSHAEEIIRSNVKGGFTYLPFIVKKLEMFEKDINPNKNYNAFVETIMLELKEAYKQ